MNSRGPEGARPKAERRDERRAGLLRALGLEVRTQRLARGLSMKVLAERAELSERFLAQLEAGAGNISIARLKDVAEALGTGAAQLLAKSEEARPSASNVVALLGLRGAGKSTVGEALARRLEVPFVELDALIAKEAGMDLATIFEIHGEAYFRRLERDVLRRVLDSGAPQVVATGGSIVTDPETFALLRSRTTLVWLKAKATDHWSRVVAQGDVRPMKNRSNAMAELKALLRARKPLYAQAHVILDTSMLGARQTIVELERSLSSHGTRKVSAR